MPSERWQNAGRTLRARYVVRGDKLVQVPLKRDPEPEPALLATHMTDMVPWFSATPPSLGLRGMGSFPAPELASLPHEFMAGPLIGWRLWRVTKKQKLQSLSYGHVWTPGKPMVGDPRPGNTHGVYAMKARGDVESFPSAETSDTVLGEVALWGRIIEHEHGYRAQFGYPLRLHMRVASPMPKFPMPGFPAASHGSVDVARVLHERYGIEVLL
jgi:hypothetical protein